MRVFADAAALDSLGLDLEGTSAWQNGRFLHTFPEDDDLIITIFDELFPES